MEPTESYNKRKDAMAWWRSLSYEEQLKLCTTIKRNPNTLTGSEIEVLYDNNLN